MPSRRALSRRPAAPAQALPPHPSRQQTKRAAPLMIPQASRQGSATITSKISLLRSERVGRIVSGTFRWRGRVLDALLRVDAGSRISLTANHLLRRPAARKRQPADKPPCLRGHRPTPIGRQSMNAPAPTSADSTASVAIPQAAAPVAAPITAAAITARSASQRQSGAGQPARAHPESREKFHDGSSAGAAHRRVEGQSFSGL